MLSWHTSVLLHFCFICDSISSHGIPLFIFNFPPQFSLLAKLPNTFQFVYICFVYAFSVHQAFCFSVPRHVWSCHTLFLCNKALFSLRPWPQIHLFGVRIYNFLFVGDDVCDDEHSRKHRHILPDRVTVSLASTGAVWWGSCPESHSRHERVQLTGSVARQKRAGNH